MEPIRARIVIGAAELNTPEVDAVLARQLSFGMAAAPERAADKKTGLLYRPWFVLMLAGALGGLVGWALIEPFFEDGVRFRGQAGQVTWGTVPGSNNVRGRVEVGGNAVWMVEGLTRVFANSSPVGFDQLERGQALEVRGHILDADRSKANALVAYEVHIQPAEARAPPQVSLQPLLVRQMIVGFCIFPLIAGVVGLFIGAADGLLSRALRRAALCGLVGLGVGLGLGLVSSFIAELAYALGRHLVAAAGVAARDTTSTVGLLAQMLSRGIAWAFAGMAMGLGQGVALRSKKVLLNGLFGGTVGALVGGLLFDPIDLLIHGGAPGAGAALSRGIGFAVIGLSVGLLIGVVELLAREAWVKMLVGPLAGKEFVLYKNPTTIGSSPKSDIYLFKDAAVEPTHALIHAFGEGYELEDRKGAAGTLLNGGRVTRRRLAPGDQIRIGTTVLSFHMKEA